MNCLQGIMHWRCIGNANGIGGRIRTITGVREETPTCSATEGFATQPRLVAATYADASFLCTRRSAASGKTGQRPLYNPSLWSICNESSKKFVLQLLSCSALLF